MKKFLEWLSSYGVLVIICLLVLNFMQQCSISRQGTKNNKAIQETTKRVDSVVGLLNGTLYVASQDEMAILLEIERLRTAKLVLYDWNTVVRTVVRPDDRMNDYDNQIDRLEKQLAAIRLNKSKTIK